MSRWFDKIKGSLSTNKGIDTLGEEYVEVEPIADSEDSKIMVRPFTLTNFGDIKQVLEAIREGKTIALINIGPIREADKTELKRAIDKLKKTIKANDGDIAGIGETWLIATPSFAKIFRKKVTKEEDPAEGEEEEL